MVNKNEEVSALLSVLNFNIKELKGQINKIEVNIKEEEVLDLNIKLINQENIYIAVEITSVLNQEPYKLIQDKREIIKDIRKAVFEKKLPYEGWHFRIEINSPYKRINKGVDNYSKMVNITSQHIINYLTLNHINNLKDINIDKFTIKVHPAKCSPIKMDLDEDSAYSPNGENEDYIKKLIGALDNKLKKIFKKIISESAKEIWIIFKEKNTPDFFKKEYIEAVDNKQKISKKIRDLINTYNTKKPLKIFFFCLDKEFNRILCSFSCELGLEFHSSPSK